MAVPDPDELLALAVEVAGLAAAVLREGAAHERSEIDTKSSLTDMVTEIDRASEGVLVEAIHRARPDDGILGEEGTSEAGSSGVRWIVDPLDGTTNYVYRLPSYAVSVGIEVDGAPTVGVVIDVARGETFAARAGGGATIRTGEGMTRPLRCSTADRLATALVGTGFGYDAGRRARQGEVVAQVLPVVRDIRRNGSAAIDLCWVAAGRQDAYYELGPRPWDIAAGRVIATEAGATVGDLRGGQPAEFTLAAAPGLFEPLRELLAHLSADAG
jgi:myo-inositol-1(or 4)-monophosphatase